MTDLSQYSDAQLLSMLQSLPAPPPSPPQVADLTNPDNIPQAEAGYVLNSANSIPGLNLLKEAGAGLRGMYAGATAPAGQSFGDAYTQEYDQSRANQDALMQATAQAYPAQTAIGKTGAALASMGVLPTPASTGSLIPDAVIGGGTAGGYGILSGLGNGQSMDERFKNALSSGKTGLELGAPLSMAAGGISQAASGIKNLIDPAEMPAVEAALENNIPIYKSNVSDSKALDYLSTLSNEIPSVIGGTSGRVPGQQEAIAEALTKPIGSSSGILNSDAVDSALATSGKQISEIAARNDVPYDSNLDAALLKVEQDSKGTMTAENYQLLQNKIQSLRDQSTNNVIPGPQYKDFRTGINQEIQNNNSGPTATYGNALRQVRNVMDDQAIANMPAADALAMQKARGIYSNAKDLQSVTDKNPTGDYSFGSLYGKLSDNPNYEQTALAAQLLKNQTGNSGTAQREYILNLARGIGAAGTGAAGLYGAKKLEGSENAGEDTLLDMAGAGLGATSIGLGNRMVNPRITPSNLYGNSALAPIAPQAAQLAELLRRMVPISSQLSQAGGQ